MMELDSIRIRAVVRMELRGYRRKRSIVATMGILPFFFLIEPVLTIFLLPASTSSADLHNYVVLPLIYLLLIPVIMPATLAAYSIVGEREQGTLEPLLTTPIRKEEFILGKAAAVAVPSVALSYTVYGLFLAAVALFAHSAVASAVFHQGPVLLALLLFAPLLAGWAIWVGMAISARSSEVRVAQQLGTLAGLPPIGVIGLMAFGVIKPTFAAAALFAIGLLAINLIALRFVSRVLDRERLVTGIKPPRSRRQGWRRPSAPAAEEGLPARAGGTPATATLRLTRGWGGGIDRNREWQIIIDGTVAGSIARRQTVELAVPPGHHTLLLRWHRHSSAARSFNASEGRVSNFSCRGAFLWPMYVAALIKPDLWIFLRQDRA